MKLNIQHTTHYTYGSPVTDSVNEIRLTPRSNGRQSLYQHEVKIEPAGSLFTYEDYFRNRVHAFSVHAPHRELIIQTELVVRTSPEQLSPRAGMSSAEQYDMLRSDWLQNRFAEYLLATEYTELSQALLEYSARYPLGRDGLYDWTRHAATGIHRDLTYDPLATHVHTTVSETLDLRRGVCQDYAHLMIALCRLNGIPARYVSGYHFVGDLSGGNADFEQASHAWVEVYIPDAGWIGLDPTNNVDIGERYVKLCHGRDYKDIVPVKGVYRGTADQQLKVTVDVRLQEQ